MTKLWEPTEDRISKTQLAEFMRQVAETGGPSIDPLDKVNDPYDQLWQWSVEEPEAFWRQVWMYTGLISHETPATFSNWHEKLERVRLFPLAKLNYAENLLRRSGDETALIFQGEGGTRREWSWNRLREEVSRLQQALKAQGIKAGDRVAGIVCNAPETIAAMLAVTSLGGIWSSCSPDFGTKAILDRFGQINPKLLFVVDRYEYGGKSFDCLSTAQDLNEAMPSVETIVTLPYDGEKAGTAEGLTAIDVFTEEVQATDLTFEPVDFHHPLFIMFSSGTTGLPKCIVHSVGGTILQNLKEHKLHCDIKPGDKLFYFTTCGWMMWNWLVAGLAAEATLVLFDGNPFYPDASALPALAARERVTHFGTSAKYLDACNKEGLRPIDTLDLSSVQTILSTGSPLAPDSFDHVYRDWKEDVCLSSIAGGTDILGCFVGGNPIGPVYRGECQKRMLGMAVEVFSADGKPVGKGEAGELVCTAPHPSQPIGFWNDQDGEKYHKAYFDTYENVWRHGDWVELTETGGMIFHGRSDATLNPGGVRIGTAEIYRQVERIPEILEAMVVGQDWDNDTRVILFVRLREGQDLSDDLVKTIKTEIRSNASPRHVPAKIIPVSDIPRTKSGKIVELAVRNIIHGRPVTNKASLANPEALSLFEDLEDLAT